MCEVMQRYEAIARNEARIETRIEDIKALIKNLGLTAEKAMDALNIPAEARAALLAAL